MLDSTSVNGCRWQPEELRRMRPGQGPALQIMSGCSVSVSLSYLLSVGSRTNICLLKVVFSAVKGLAGVSLHNLAAAWSCLPLSTCFGRCTYPKWSNQGHVKKSRWLFPIYFCMDKVFLPSNLCFLFPNCHHITIQPNISILTILIFTTDHRFRNHELHPTDAAISTV